MRCPGPESKPETKSGILEVYYGHAFDSVPIIAPRRDARHWQSGPLTARTQNSKPQRAAGQHAYDAASHSRGQYRDVKIIRNIIAAIAALALCADLSGCGSTVQTAHAAQPSDPTSTQTTWTAPQNFTDGVQVNLLGIGAPAGAATRQVQYLQVAPGPTIAELLTQGTAGQVATLWSNTSYSKQLELCLDIAESDCAGATIPGAPGDGHLWSFATLHVIGATSIVFENASTHLATLDQDGFSPAVPVILPMSTVAALPACNAGLNGAMAAVSDATAPAYNAGLTDGGTSSIPVYCNGINWTAH